MNEYRFISFPTYELAAKRFDRHFAGRIGCKLVNSDGDHGGLAPGSYVVCPVDVGLAWDRGLDRAQAIPKVFADRGQRQAAAIEEELDKAAPRA